MLSQALVVALCMRGHEQKSKCQEMFSQMFAMREYVIFLTLMDERREMYLLGGHVCQGLRFDFCHIIICLDFAQILHSSLNHPIEYL
jgi:hypothetical protein